jgi:hypothetical protein
MTADQRVAALEGFGFYRAPSAVPGGVALHSGYCLRRQYEAFAGIQYGKNVRHFLDGLVERRLAESIYRPRRSRATSITSARALSIASLATKTIGTGERGVPPRSREG